MAEADFLEAVTQTQQVVVHFFHREFTRCKIVDKHLQELTRKFFKTRFIKISAPVRLPCLYPIPWGGCPTARLRLSLSVSAPHALRIPVHAKRCGQPVLPPSCCSFQNMQIAELLTYDDH